MKKKVQALNEEFPRLQGHCGGEKVHMEFNEVSCKCSFAMLGSLLYHTFNKKLITKIYI